MRHSKKILSVAALAFLAALMLFAYVAFAEKTVAGDKFVTVEVTDNSGSVTVYEVQSNAEYLIQVMEQAEGLTFAFTEGQYGASVHTVNGLRADYALDGAYWSFFVNEEYCNYGISQQPVEDGDRFQTIHPLA